MANNQEIAAKLRLYREACALSHQQVADALNIERSTYTKYETAKSEPNLSTLVKIAAIFHISPLELLPMGSVGEESSDSIGDAFHADSPIFQLSKDERGLIARYRALSREKKKEALALMGNLSKKE